MIKGVAPSISVLLILEPVTLTRPKSCESPEASVASLSSLVSTVVSATVVSTAASWTGAATGAESISSPGLSAKTKPTVKKENIVKYLKLFIAYPHMIMLNTQHCAV